MVHPSKPGNPPTLLDGLQQLLIYEIANGGQISVLNRLDRETSGLVLVAKNRQAAARLGKAWANREFAKTYLAIVHGWPEQEQFSVDAALVRRGEYLQSEIYVRQMVHAAGKAAQTDFSVKERFERDGKRYSLLECRPTTGRTHQIRVHLEHMGLPIVGDKIYGHSGAAYLEFIRTGWTEKLQNQLLLNRQALHASRLDWGNFSWQADFPSDLKEFLKK